MPAETGSTEAGTGLRFVGRKMRRRFGRRRLPSELRLQDFGAAVLPPIFSHVPLATYFHEIGSLSTVLCPAHACLPAAQSFCPALATPKHLSLLASGGTGAAETDAARPSASKPATAACIVVCCFMNVSPWLSENELNHNDAKDGR